MQPRSLLAVALLASGIAWGGVTASGSSERPYALSCTSLWTKLNDAPLTIEPEPFTDIFWVDAAQKTVNGIRATFSEREISWDNEALSKNTVSADRTTHFANRITGKYMVLIRSFNPTKPGQDISEYAGECVRNPQG
jgi:hypothetical protein